MNIFRDYENINLIIYNVSRFTRDSLNGIKIYSLCQKKNITIHFVDDLLKSDNIHDLHQIRRRLSDATYESDRYDRISKSNRLLRNMGWYFGNPKFGYKIKFVKTIRKKVINKYEKNIIEFITKARIGSCSSLELNQVLKKIKPEETNPIVFLENDTKIINSFSKQYTLTFGEIADLLNEYEIYNRNRPWNAQSVNRVYNNNNNNRIHNYFTRLRI